MFRKLTKARLLCCLVHTKSYNESTINAVWSTL